MSEKNNAPLNAPARPTGRPAGGPMGPGGFGAPVQKAKNFKDSLKRLLNYLKPHYKKFVIVIILALLSTVFQIVSPKVIGEAMNAMQDGYMAKVMLEKMTDGQSKAVVEIEKQMGEAQATASSQIINKMGDAQITASNQIVDKMSQAQNKASNSIISKMSDAQITAGQKLVEQMGNAQLKATNGIIDGMAATQKTILTYFSKPMPTPGLTPPPTMSPATMKAIGDFMALPLISKQTSRSDKIQTVLKLMDVLAKLPPMGSAPSSSSQISTTDMKALLNLPLVANISNRNYQIVTVIKLIDLFKKMPSTSGASISKSTMNTLKELLRLPLVKYLSNPTSKLDYTIELADIFKKMPSQTSSSSQSIDPASLDKIKKILLLNKVSGITGTKAKIRETIKLLEAFKDMPSQGSTSTKDFDPKTIDVLISLLKLNRVNDIKNPAAKLAETIKLLDVFKKMPKQDTKVKQEINPKAMDDIKKILLIAKIKDITDPELRLSTTIKLLEAFKNMPKIDTKGKTNVDKTLDPTTMDSVIEMLKLPMLSSVTDPSIKADITQKFMDLSKNMPSSKAASDQFGKSNVKFTDEQIKEVIDNIRQTNGKIDLSYIGIIALLLIGMYLISSVFSVWMGLVMSGVAQKTTMDLRRQVELKINKLPLKYFDSHPHGDILSRVTNDVDTISNTLQQSLTQVITSIIQILGYTIMMLTISPLLTLIVIATLPLYVAATAMIAKQSQKYFAAQQKELGLLSGHVEEMYSGHKIVKAFGHEQKSVNKFNVINKRLYGAGWKAQFISGIMFPLMNFISNLGYVAICIVGGIWITQGQLKIGDITAFIQYSRQFTMPIVQTANIANIIQSTVACAERVFEVLDEEEELQDVPGAKVLEAPKGKVEFKDVAFRYTEEIPLIENLNLTVEPGHTVAIVGPTGAGKTTLVNLIMRFYEINAGKILVDNLDITELKRNELHSIFGMVLQDTWLFNGTIRDNIAYGRANATEEEVTAAAKAAYADHFIRTLPDGYDTILNEEATNISQGQKQLLTIARAIMADPAILILDEATSSVDTRTEVLIQKAMAKLMKNRTSFVIAHRLSTIRDAETILVMNQGSIIEQGNHNQLLAQNGFYADLYNSQFAGEVEEPALDAKA